PGQMGPTRPGVFGGPGMAPEIKLVEKFDKDGNGWLDAAERKAAREYLRSAADGIRGFGGPGRGPGGFGPFGRRPGQEQPSKGASLTPKDVKWYQDSPLYAPDVLRTLFLEFENPDWEDELADFKNTDVEVPARLVVDGKTYRDVGVHFHGTSSYMGVPKGLKRSLVLTLDLVHRDQNLYGYRKLLLLNSHNDPSFLRTVLAFEIARDYMPAPKANHVRVVINGECWGVYVNQQFFNKDFIRDWFGTTRGARWKVPGSPNGRAGLGYWEDQELYRRAYEIKSRDDPKAWAELINLCKVLNQTPLENLESELGPLLDIDATLRFLAWENVIASEDGYYARASDYNIYKDERGRFHIIPYDANECFSVRGGPGGPGGPRGFGPSGFLATHILEQADTNKDGALSKGEFVALADAWFDRMDTEKSGSLGEDQFAERFAELVVGPRAPRGFGPQDDGPTGPGGFGPQRFMAPLLFAALDANRDGSLSRSELREVLGKWFASWDPSGKGTITAEKLHEGLAAVLPTPGFGRGPGPEARPRPFEEQGQGMGGSSQGRPGWRGGGPGFGPGGPGFGPGGGGVTLDPLVALNDPNKPLRSRLLAVPGLRARYLGYVRDMAEKWLDWNRLGALAKKYHDLIAEDVRLDTKKLDSYEAFQSSILDETSSSGGSPRVGSLKTFVDQRRAFLLNHDQIKNLPKQQ
ncbi:MAG: CotH kinase family protein, partial [Verrucomicrobiae bacterium]|nr:CotH kinase family protein [Verrucomicrobiae bacterium]